MLHNQLHSLGRVFIPQHCTDDDDDDNNNSHSSIARRTLMVFKCLSLILGQRNEVAAEIPRSDLLSVNELRNLEIAEHLDSATAQW